ncbi:MAG: ester cyclase [Acidimicrobiia bacterium]|nr:ester cyclase [Acidimicrobiia bacterium]
MTVATDQKQIFRDVIEEVWHRGNLRFIAEAYSPEFVGNSPSLHLQTLGAYRQYVTEARVAFPDIHFEVAQQIEDGDFVASRYQARGTHGGDFMGIPPTGNAVSFEGICLQRLSGGRIAESWNYWDALGLLHAIGVIPELQRLVERRVA